MRPDPAQPGSGPLSLFFPKLEAGGAERVMLDLARGLFERGHAVDVVLGSRQGGLARELPPEIRLFDLGAERLRYALKGLTGYLRSERPACLLATIDHAGVLALSARALSRTGLPVIVRVANTLSQKAADARAPFERATFVLARLMYPRADLIVAPSRGVADDTLNLLKLPEAKVRVIPNPVIGNEVFELAQLPVPHPWFQQGMPPVILAAGRLTLQKDFPTLLAAFKQVRSEVECRLVILGEGPLRHTLEGLAQKLGVAEHFDLPGFESNPFAYMSKAAVFALSSRYEGLPSVLIQALACGAPVVATDCPSGPAEILDAGRYGRLVPVGDTEELAKALYSIISSPVPAVEDEAWRRYSVSTSLDLYERAIEEVCGS